MLSNCLQMFNIVMTLLGLPLPLGCGNLSMNIIYKLALFFGSLLDLGNIGIPIISNDQEELPPSEKDCSRAKVPTENTSDRRRQKDNERHADETEYHIRTIRRLQKEVATLADEKLKTKRDTDLKIRLLLEERDLLRNENVEKATKIEDLENDKREASNRIISLESTLEDLKKQVVALTATAQEWEGEICDMREERARLEEAAGVEKDDASEIIGTTGKKDHEERKTCERENAEERDRNAIAQVMKEVEKIQDGQEEIRELLLEEEKRLQEMGRKLQSYRRNSGYAEVMREVAKLKEEIERLRRQVKDHVLVKRDGETDDDLGGHESDSPSTDSDKKTSKHEPVRKKRGKMRCWKKWRKNRRLKGEAKHDPVWEELREALLRDWQRLSHSEAISKEELDGLLQDLEEMLKDDELPEELETVSEEIKEAPAGELGELPEERKETLNDEIKEPAAEGLEEFLEEMEGILKEEIKKAAGEEVSDLLEVIEGILEDAEDMPEDDMDEIVEVVQLVKEAEFPPEEMEELLKETKQTLREEMEELSREDIEELREGLEESLKNGMRAIVKKTQARRWPKRKRGKKAWRSLLREHQERKAEGQDESQKEMKKRKKEQGVRRRKFGRP
ncbi:uncharacterized protein PF3D7_1120000-like [Macrobrachium rosenbergii]|uniref:uncharacterized protein PF3D7_1120000-like n=1 Tax=Macrobrachium rosenbergii TaxID=79674 RepID=UPI0034D5BFA1